jgi:ubiquinol-cytochrome c reductase cytochrome b subunit
MALHEVGSTIRTASTSRSRRRIRAPACRSTRSTAIRTTRSRTSVGVIVFLFIFSVVVFFMPEMGGYFLEANNFIPADSLKTPAHIAPVWYFTPYYSILRAVRRCSIPSSRASRRMGVAVMIFFALPWLDKGRGQVDPLSRLVVQASRWRIFVITFLVLGWLGTMPTDALGKVGDLELATLLGADLHDPLLPLVPA